MATIQIRDIPEDAYEVLRRRARQEGRSIQAYMRDMVVQLARVPTKAEHLAAVQAALERYGDAQAGPDALAADVAAERR